jgi:hypothetical protein
MNEEQKHGHGSSVTQEYLDFNSRLMEAIGVPLLSENEGLSRIQQRAKGKFDEALRGQNQIRKQGGFVHE